MSPSVYLFALIAMLLATAPSRNAERGIQGNRPARAESEVFEHARHSVFVIETESGHGSGFLVDVRGLILTNHHVLGKTPYLAVSVDSKRKYPAVVVARDAFRDLAVVRVHPRAVEGLEPLAFNDSATDVNVGERVLAIGSALSGTGVLTTGIVSRLEADTIIADLNVNPGSSGGPLLNLNGEVVGLCTFYMKAPAGPGLAGIVRAHAARPIVAKATQSLPLESPPFDALPVASSIPYPANTLRDRAAAIRNPAEYGTTSGGMRIDVLTPPVVYYEAHELEIRQAQKHADAHGRGPSLERDRPRYAWHAYNGDVEAIIGIRAVPAVSDVRAIRLLRNGVEVVPIVPGRFCTNPVDAAPHRPAGCFGLYQYAPSAFAPGAELEVRVYSDNAPTKPRVWNIPARVVSRVWADFAPWLAVAICPALCVSGWLPFV